MSVATQRDTLNSTTLIATNCLISEDPSLMFSIVKAARDQPVPESPLARLRGRYDERPWERGWEAEQEARWAEHLSEVLSRPPALIVAEVQDPDTDLDVSTAPPGKEEIITVIRSFQNGKAPGQHSLNVELCKAEPEFAALTNLATLRNN